MCDEQYYEDMCEECVCYACSVHFEETDHGDQLAIRIQDAVNRRD